MVIHLHRFNEKVYQNAINTLTMKEREKERVEKSDKWRQKVDQVLDSGQSRQRQIVGVMPMQR